MPEDLLHQLLDWVAAYPGQATLIVFLAALGESLAIVGMLVPGVLIILGAGALIATGHLAFWPTCAAAVAGAIIGDGLSYWLGCHFQQRIRRFWPFSRYPRSLDQGIGFFHRHGAKSVVFGRFVGPGRAVIPLVAGMLRMPPRRFLLANIGSALAWGPAYLAPGIVFGASLKLAAEAATRLVVLLLVLLGLLWATAWLTRRLYLLLCPHTSAWVRGLLHWANLHPNLGRIAAALADPTHPDAATLAALAAALIGATAMLGLSLGVGLVGAEALTVNQVALDFGLSLHTPPADQIMVTLAQLGAPIVTGTLMLAMAAQCWLAGQHRNARYWLAPIGFALVATPLLGWALQVSPPDLELRPLIPPTPLALDDAWPWSFPSLPVLGATLAYGFLALAWSRGLPPTWRTAPAMIAAVMIAAVALARVYLGAEWLTDVIGSIALGLAWLAALGLAYHRHSRRPRPRTRMVIVALLAAAGAFAALGLTRQQADLILDRPQPPVCIIDAGHWSSRAVPTLPTHREDLRQRHQWPFDLQYAGPVDDLMNAIAQTGWQPPDLLGWHNAIKLLSPSLGLSELPVISHIHAGRHEALVLVREPPGPTKSRLVLRLWATPCEIQGDPSRPSQPLWLGTISALRQHEIVGLLALPVTAPATNQDQPTPVETLRHDLRQAPILTVATGRPLLVAPRATGLLGD